MTNWDPTPWMVKGAKHSAEVGRLAAFVASRGSEGIVLPADLKPRPRAQASAGITIDPGAAVVLNRFSNSGGRQSYFGRLPILEDVPIAPTGSSGGRSDLVVGEVIDPQYVGQPPADPFNFQYMNTSVIQGVSPSITKASQLGLPRSIIEICRVDQPVNNSSVIANQIVDLRRLANARERTDRAMIQGLDLNHVVAGGWRQFSSFTPNFYVPDWATHLSMEVVLASAINYSGETVGVFNCVFGTGGGRKIGPNINWDEKEVATSDGIRHFYMVPALDLDIRAFAGTTQPAALFANTQVGTMSMRGWGAIRFELTFQEKIV